MVQKHLIATLFVMASSPAFAQTASRVVYEDQIQPKAGCVSQSGIPAADQSLSGWSNNVTLAAAIRQVVPSGFRVVDNGLLASDAFKKKSSWSSDGSWPDTLSGLCSRDFFAHIDWDAKSVSLAAPAPIKKPTAMVAAKPSAAKLDVITPEDSKPEMAAVDTPVKVDPPLDQPLPETIPDEKHVTTVDDTRSRVIIDGQVLPLPSATPTPAKTISVIASAPSSMMAKTDESRTSAAKAPVVTTTPTSVSPAVASAIVPVVAAAPIVPEVSLETAPSSYVTSATVAEPVQPVQLTKTEAPKEKETPVATVAKTSPPATKPTAPPVVKVQALSQSRPSASTQPNSMNQTWVLDPAFSLRENVEAWAKQAGWNKVIWSAADYPIMAPAQFTGHFASQTGPIAQVVAAYDSSEQPLQARLSVKDKVIEVRNKYYDRATVSPISPEQMSSDLFKP